MSVHHVVLGDPSHGVTRLALQLTGGHDRTTIAALDGPDAAEAARRRLPRVAAAPALHLHLTDALLGPDPVPALRTIVGGRRVAITLHDVPQAAEGANRARRRAGVYRGLADVADLVIVSSVHERDGLRAAGADADAVLPLPIDARRVPAAPTGEPTVGVLGWMHPGKGHDVLAAALATLPRPTTLVAIGAPVPGHERYADELAARCAELGVGYRCTGYLGDMHLLEEAARVGVGVCPHRHVSASGTVGSWLSASRRPIVGPSGYAREVDARLPGALRLTDDLAAAVDAALRDPSSTLLPAGVVVGPTTAEAARAQDDLLRRWARAAPVAR